MKHLHRWHWVSSGLSLACMIFFAGTGITLNHAGAIAGSPRTVRAEGTLSAAALRLLASGPADEAKQPLPPAVAAEAAAALHQPVPSTAAEWSADAVDLPLARPGAEGTLSIDRASGALDYELTEHGWIAWANDLHKGRHAGSAWFWFIDLFAVGVLMFALTGLCLLYLHARGRPRTWPVVGFGLALPLILILLFVHS